VIGFQVANHRLNGCSPVFRTFKKKEEKASTTRYCIGWLIFRRVSQGVF
jgi:hypothetical protein